MSLTMRPEWPAIAGSINSRRRALRRQRPSLIHAHEARVTDHVGRHDRRKPPLKAFLYHVGRSPRVS